LVRRIAGVELRQPKL